MKTLKKYLTGTVLVMLFACLFIGVKAEAAAPGKVTGVKQADAGSDSIKMQWNYLEGNDLRYEVWVSTDEKSGYVLYDTAYGNVNYMYVNRRNAGKTYFVKVRAYTHVYDDKTYEYVDTYGDYSAPVKMVTDPSSKPARLRQSAATAQSITLKWNKVEGATGYNIYYKTDSAKNWKKTTSSTNTKKISGLSKNTEYQIKVYAFRKDGNFTAESDFCENLWGVPTLPTAISGTHVGTYYNVSQRVWIEWDKKANADGYQYELYYGNKKVKSGQTTSDYVVLDAKANRVYKIRLRGYITIDGKKKYGSYSSWYYFAQQPQVTKVKNTTGGLQVQWKKTSGATNYTIYVSTNAKRGYKKAVTTTKTSYKVTKYGSSRIKSGKKYYVYVVANKKVGSKTYKSDAQYYYYQR